MKIITTIISIIGMHYMASAQVAPRVSHQPLPSAAAKTAVCFVISPSETKPSHVTPGTSDQYNVITITRLPSSEQVLTSVNIELGMMGFFTFKKDKSLNIPADREVFIEDKLSGKMFNIKACETYAFNVIQHIPNRFVMHVLVKSNPETLVSSGAVKGDNTKN